MTVVFPPPEVALTPYTGAVSVMAAPVRSAGATETLAPAVCPEWPAVIAVLPASIPLRVKLYTFPAEGEAAATDVFADVKAATLLGSLILLPQPSIPMTISSVVSSTINGILDIGVKVGSLAKTMMMELNVG